MPRNDQVTRQWHVLHLLGASSGLALDELMERLPADYPRHTRTLRRDLGALEMAGFPLVNERVDGRVRWRLMDGFRKIPALNFSPTELMALLLGRHLLKPLDGTHIHAALDSALSKAAAVLPAASHDYVHQLQGVFTVGIGPHKLYRQHRDSIDRLTQAIAQAKTVQLRYFSASRGRLSRREIDPYRLWYASGGLYLVAYCHLRRDVRMFAVERIQSVTLTDHPYQMPLGFDLEAYVQDALTVMRGTADRSGGIALQRGDGCVGARSHLASQPAVDAIERQTAADDARHRRFPRTRRVGVEFRQRRAGNETGITADRSGGGSSTDCEHE